TLPPLASNDLFDGVRVIARRHGLGKKARLKRYATTAANAAKIAKCQNPQFRAHDVRGPLRRNSGYATICIRNIASPNATGPENTYDNKKVMGRRPKPKYRPISQPAFDRFVFASVGSAIIAVERLS
ncbi:MAG: hypothetical protein ABR555_20095, partial [Pyrinomonadaceae bacterium]